MSDWNELSSIAGKWKFCRIYWQWILIEQTSLYTVVYRTFLYNPTNLKVPKKAPCHLIHSRYSNLLTMLCSESPIIGLRWVNTHYDKLYDGDPTSYTICHRGLAVLCILVETYARVIEVSFFACCGCSYHLLAYEPMAVKTVFVAVSDCCWKSFTF